MSCYIFNEAVKILGQGDPIILQEKIGLDGILLLEQPLPYIILFFGALSFLFAVWSSDFSAPIARAFFKDRPFTLGPSLCHP
jgi:hypothetical protein